MLARTFQIGTALGIAITCFGWPKDSAAQDSGSRSSFRQAESQQVEDYLKTLQLDELLIEHLEIETSREVNLEARRAMASRLVNEYAQRMMSGRILANSQWQTKSELLLKIYPELETPFVRIAILQSKYVHGEKAFQHWWDSGGNESEKRQLAGDWRILKTELESLNRKLTAELEDQVATLQTIAENREDESRHLARLEGLVLHTDYLIGWSAYFLGVLTPENRKLFMQTADEHFRNFLQIEPKKMLTEVSPEWFDFSSDWHARALVGLAMSQRGLDHAQQSKYCFDLIGSHAVSLQTRDLRFVWDLNSRIYLNEVSAALEIVESAGEVRQISEAGRIAFWMATLKAGVATRDQAPLVSQRLFASGLTGLARGFEAPLIRVFLNEHDVRLIEDTFLSRWIGGYMDFHDALDSNQPAKYDSARSQLGDALEIADDSTSPFDIARCQYLLARIQFHDKEYEDAANAFLDCSKLVSEIDPHLAAESQWLAIRSLSELTRRNPRSLIQANRAIDQILRRFPGSTFAKKAEFEKLRLSVSPLPANRAIDRLRRVDSDDLNHASAVNEIAKIQYQSWLREHQANSETESQSLNALVEVESEFRQLSSAGEDSKLKTMLLVVDALLRSEPLDVNAVRERLDLAKAMTENASLKRQFHNEYRYYEFLYASRAGQEQRAISEAQWLSENAQGTSFEKSALIQLAQLADQRLETQSDPTPEDLHKVIEIFERLVERLGSSDDNLKTLANARVAYARLAELRLKAGSVDGSIEMFESLNRVFPKHKTYLRQLGLARTSAKQFPDAMLIWRQLIAGVDPGTDLWLESKYYLAFCLFQTGDRENALRLHRQTRRLSPELPEKWKTRFNELFNLLENEKAN